MDAEVAAIAQRADNPHPAGSRAAEIYATALRHHWHKHHH